MKIEHKRCAEPVAFFPELPMSVIAEVVDASGERVYGAVEAPGWVPIVGGIAAVATALLPVLLAPGEKAFNRQQEDEFKTKGKFNDRQGR